MTRSAPIYRMIAGRLRSRRLEAAVSEVDVASFCGCRPTDILRFESGAKHLPINVLYAYAVAIGVELRDCLPTMVEVAAHDEPVPPPEEAIPEVKVIARKFWLCPFCSSDRQTVESSPCAGRDGYVTFVRCLGCRACGPLATALVGGEPMSKAIEQWNMRNGFGLKRGG